ncbi:MAG TPA: hypothetical protein VM912_08345 [Terriglobales bacterium]|nr:hypothetical protein [Terriglobales bacterium]
MDKFRNTGLACVAWLGVAAFAACAADGQTAQAPAGGAYASEVPPSENSMGTDLTGSSSDDSIPVAAETAFVLRNKYRKAGGYDENLKRVARIESYGTRYVDCEHYPVEIRVTRPDSVGVLVKAGASSDFAVRKSGSDIVIRGIPQGIPGEDERALLETFDFDTPIVDLQKEHPTLRPVGMQKIPHILAWKFESDHAGEYYRVLYVDAHSGDVARYTVMKVGGVPLLDVALHDYRIVKGIRVPFAIDYRTANGTLLASDRFERVEVTQR